jgi:hypothetical protein
MAKAKYIRTKDNEIIVFSELQLHSKFKHFEPISAGFIFFSIDEDRNNPDCICYGESISLGLKSNDDDTQLAKRQILGWDYY